MADKKSIKNTKDLRTSPVGLLNTGKEYKKACEIISERCLDRHPSLPNTDLYKVRLYLIGHAFELLFKSILLKCGVELSELKSKKFGHDIVALVGKIEEFSLFTLSDVDKALLNLLNFYYKDKDFEYHVRGAKQYPNATDLINLCDRLFIFVENWLHVQSVQKSAK